MKKQEPFLDAASFWLLRQTRKSSWRDGSPGPACNTKQTGHGRGEERKEGPGEGTPGPRSFRSKRTGCGAQIHPEAEIGEDTEGIIGLGFLEVACS